MFLAEIIYVYIHKIFEIIQIPRRSQNSHFVHHKTSTSLSPPQSFPSKYHSPFLSGIVLFDYAGSSLCKRLRYRALVPVCLPIVLLFELAASEDIEINPSLWISFVPSFVGTPSKEGTPSRWTQQAGWDFHCWYS